MHVFIFLIFHNMNMIHIVYESYQFRKIDTKMIQKGMGD